MRHSTIDLTMNVYTDPKLLDVHGAVEALPELPIEPTEDETQAATGTTDASSQLAPMLAPTADNRCKSETFADKTAGKHQGETAAQGDGVSAYGVKQKEPQSTADNDSDKWTILDSNQRPPRCQRIVKSSEVPKATP